MGNAAPPIKRLREELHYECNARSLLQVLCHVRRLVLEVHTDKAGHRLTWEWEVRKGADCLLVQALCHARRRHPAPSLLGR